MIEIGEFEINEITVPRLELQPGSVTYVQLLNSVDLQSAYSRTIEVLEEGNLSCSILRRPESRWSPTGIFRKKKVSDWWKKLDGSPQALQSAIEKFPSIETYPIGVFPMGMRTHVGIELMFSRIADVYIFDNYGSSPKTQKDVLNRVRDESTSSYLICFE